MYVSNPNVMGVFAYALRGNIGNPADYVNATHEYYDSCCGELIEQNLEFLKQYALEKGLSFVVFGE